MAYLKKIMYYNMNKNKLRNLFILTILIIIILFSLVLVIFNTVEGMIPYQHNYLIQNNNLIQDIL